MMNSTIKYQEGCTVQMRKPHPCGSSEWEIISAGLFFQIRCRGCGRRVEMRRDSFEKSVRKIVSV
jgi:hypothetical protein